MATQSRDPYGVITASFGQSQVTVTTAGTPVAVSATDLFVQEVEFHARKNKTTANTGAVYVGPVAAPLRVLLAGEVWKVSTEPNGELINLKDWYVDAATNGDGVLVTYRN